MNWVDLVIIAVLVFFVFESLRKSFLSELLDFLSFLLAFFLSLRFYSFLADFFVSNFQIPHSFANVLGFIAAWFLVETALFFVLHLILPKLKALALVDQKLHPLVIFPAFLRGLIFVAIILVLVATFPIQPKIKLAVQKSLVGSYILTQTQQLEAPLKSVFGGLGNDTLTFFTIKPKSDETVDLGFQTTEFQQSPALEQDMIGLVNGERQKIGLKTLKFDQTLTEVGRVHSADMFKRGYFSHFSPEGETVADRAKKKGVKYFVIGENLAYAPSLQLAHNGLMNSEGHRANILSEEYSRVGIGIQDGGVYGLMITQVFGD